MSVSAENMSSACISLQIDGDGEAIAEVDESKLLAAIIDNKVS